jgi:hypothetical protein
VGEICSILSVEGREAVYVKLCDSIRHPVFVELFQLGQQLVTREAMLVHRLHRSSRVTSVAPTARKASTKPWKHAATPGTPRHTACQPDSAPSVCVVQVQEPGCIFDSAAAPG